MDLYDGINMFSFSIILFIQALGDKKELNDYWLSSSVTNFTWELLGSKSRISSILQEEHSAELELGMLQEDLNSAFSQLNIMSSSMANPQFQTWSQIRNSLEKATRIVDTIAGEYNKTDQLTDKRMKQLEEIQLLVNGLLSVVKEDVSETGEIEEESIQEIKELTLEFNQ